MPSASHIRPHSGDNRQPEHVPLRQLRLELGHYARHCQSTIYRPDPNGLKRYVVLGSKIIFNAYNTGASLPGRGYTSLFVSDGSIAGTHPIKLA